MARENIKVLIVDEHKTMLRIIRNLLNQVGISDVDQVTDGSEALEKFNQKNYGLVVCEWDIPGMTGYELLKSIRAGSKNDVVPFIMMAAETKPDNVMKAKQAGVNGYIIKPFSQDVFVNKVSKILRIGGL